MVSASRFGLASCFGARVWIGVDFWCLWGRSSFDGCVLLSLSPWGYSGSMTRSSWDGLEVFVLFSSSGWSVLGLFEPLGVGPVLGTDLVRLGVIISHCKL